MFIDTKEATAPAVDLTNPSLEGISYLLRHKEMWPAGFEWDFGTCTHCAMGLASEIWPSKVWAPSTGVLSRAVGIPQYDAVRLFILGYNALSAADVTPEIVADAIDKYLADH